MKTLMKAVVLIAGAAMTMGNQKCEQKVQPSARSLKKIVDLGAIRSSPINFPGGQSFDFQFVANQQIYSVLLESKQFAFKYNPPIAVPPAQATGDQNFFNLSKADGQMMKAFAEAVGKDNYSLEYAKTAWCMVNLPQAKISGSVNSFELIGGGGLNIGFTPAGAYPVSGASLGFNIEFMQLDLSMVATRPLTSSVMAATNVTSKQTKTKVNLGINLGTISIGPSFYHQSPLAQVSKNGLAKAVNDLSTQLTKEEWYTRVMANHDTHMVIRGGSDVNLEVGDELLIYNEDYYWEGEPCNSKYLGGGAAANSAVAKIQIDWVGDEISRGRVVQQTDENAVIGAKVKLYKMHADDYKAPDAGVTPVTPVQSESGSNSGQNSSKPSRG